MKKTTARPSYRMMYNQTIGQSVKTTRHAWGKTKQKFDEARTSLSGHKGGKVIKERKANRALDVELATYGR